MTQNLTAQLELLHELIGASIDVLKENSQELLGTPISLDGLKLHPVHQSINVDVRKALKTISSSSQMLRAVSDPHTCINDLFTGFHDGTSLLVAVKAGVAHVIGDKEMHIDEISKVTDIEADRLSRFLRNLCNNHVFKEVAPDVFANNSLSSVLLDKGKSAYIELCLSIVRRSSCKAWEALTYSEFKNSEAPNKTAFNIAYETPLKIFQYISEVEPEIGKLSKIGFASGTKVNTGEYLDLYPWARENGAKIVDVGGGVGGGTLPIVKAFPSLRLVVQDIPDSQPGFEKLWNDEYPSAIADGRVIFAGHDFFESQPEDADIYFMRHVIHDWPDAEALKILQNTAAKMKSSTKLLLCEHVVFPSYRKSTKDGIDEETDGFVAPRPLLANWGNTDTSRLDLQVLATLNARQRTKDQYVALLQKAELGVVRIWKNMGPLAIIESRKL
ncbi:hypothetical protein ACN47E_007633 [Coniothyrium glycines]